MVLWKLGSWIWLKPGDMSTIVDISQPLATSKIDTWQCVIVGAQVGKKKRWVEHVNAPFEVLYWKVRIQQLDDPRWPSLHWPFAIFRVGWQAHAQKKPRWIMFAKSWFYTCSSAAKSVTGRSFSGKYSAIDFWIGWRNCCWTCQI